MSLFWFCPAGDPETGLPPPHMVQVLTHQEARILFDALARLPPGARLGPADWTAPTLIGYAPVGWPQGLAWRGCAGLG